ncbi:UDP-N-acetylglucosamine 2-epimerase (non-hydrolyzing) [Aureibaculum sp. 2210JD6-5]|uniref:non-hydrolyzing UDP-N-acetylglucosamine 2-epimerase n=1 Tax=Aureibaculum sp. 2210JD6-5 TaxID=3103957 RepID=UPI002AAEEF48|nr:UDP-N-acetylglucosamine 2-epimerase (non-hydrolyzing) [Aureibaculum sp. 2210JD6-5]MDY7394190.1 UDP-N-acetylglucosamine 2-epimerase (non-hydrolyzing) [Aureibaculum sp. 2210JD6-5]
MKLDIIAGARPNFMKIAPIIEELEKVKDKIQYRLIHTGQHYDKKMSGSFFEELGIPDPDVNLEVGSGTQAEQTARIMERYEALLLKDVADYCLVVGDVTSTMACSIAAKKLGVKVIHVEGGIRSNDITMPEEINRMVTDAITDIFYTTSEVANENLRHLGHDESKIRYVGNTMIDTLLDNMPRFKQPDVFKELNLKEKGYFVMTLHRPANVDQEQKLKSLIDEIVKGAKGMPLVFPVHPRTAKILQQIGIEADNLHMIEPLGYLEFNYLVKHAFAVVTDSGGITEETTVMKVPCMTLRDNTERPETITIGTNELVGTDPKNVAPYMKKLHDGEWKSGEIPHLWDGKTAKRIVEDLLQLV